MNGNILTPGGWVRGRLRFGARIDSIDGARCDPSTNADDAASRACRDQQTASTGIDLLFITHTNPTP